ncbi:C25 family cysteine peptidase [Desulfopila aestuarii]|uniref:Peptidase family C25 n=1 Tax=Desulfopila aestuarii DSM 18488 TaxID=1121416 RepID=A0A1M7Y5B1_9BACT|nr:C25 family cysteine peptidase [Desulfopila aestuarii]SHO47613.1 Peptidase family C25 [Desulfopila aestuarii DSM 18488]
MKKLAQHVFFSRYDLTIRPTPFGTHFSLKGCLVKGRPGAPALPVRNIRIALPPDTGVTAFRVEIVTTTLVTQQPTMIACIQPLPDPVWLGLETVEADGGKRFLPEENLYRQVMDGKKERVVMGGPMQVGNIPIATFDIFPLGYRKDGTVELIEHLILHLLLDKDEAIFVKPQITKSQRYKEHSLVHDMVINPERVLKTPLQLKKMRKPEDVLSEVIPFPKGPLVGAGPPVPVPKQVDYLIITDNDKWNSQAMASTGPAGDLVAEFQRLAAHKKARGYRTHIARVRDIVDGGYGNFSAGARDLQEIIRNFLKQFVIQKGVEFLLLGGDVSIIPPRQACASAWGRIELGSLADKNTSEWKGSYLGMRVDTNHFGQTTHFLTNYLTGELIPYDASGTSNATTIGWYHTTSDTFATRSAAPTQWIRVNGPEAHIKGEMVWYTPTNMLPTDMYFSSLYGQHYNTPGRHDWDRLNNGLYGQHNHTAIDLDGVDFTVDVAVGRAPVESVDEARIFVDKVIAYDNWGKDHVSSDYNRFKRMLFVAEHWARYFHSVIPQAGNSFPPANNRFTTFAADGYALIHDESFIGDNCGDKIICNYSDSSCKVLDYNLEAKNGTPGWYFAKSANNLQPSYWVLDLWLIKIKLPTPTPWIVVYGPPADIAPMSYDIDREETDSSVTQQEELRTWLKNNFSRINQVDRLYSDVTDMPPGSTSGATLKKLTTENLEAALNTGPHFVSLTGHGNWTGVAHLNHALIGRLVNGPKTFIAFADSCLTGKFDENDAIGESLVKKEDGGAVAYIGNSRYSWIGVGDDFRFEFFKCMKYWRSIGNLNDSRCTFRNDTNYWQYQLWTILEQTLFGDPEMNVYRTDEDAYPRFIGNHNTMELHQSTCQWVKKMANWNKRYYDSIEEGINLGYDGCAFCLKAYNHG